MRRRPSRRAWLRIAVMGSLCLSNAGLSAEVPMVLHSTWPYQDATYPRWVEATAAVAPDGRLDAKLFHPDYLGDLQGFLDRTPDPSTDCLAYGEFYGDEVNPPDRSSPEKLVQTSASILVGVVTDRAFGFEFTIPGQMLEVEITDALPRTKVAERVLVFVPVARFEAAGKLICKTDKEYAPPPPIGGRVALFVPDAPTAHPYLNLRFASSFATLEANELVVSREVQPDRRGWGEGSEPSERLIPRSRFDAALRARFGQTLRW